MIAGYVVSFVVMGLYVASIYLRNRNLNRDKAMLEEMDKPAPKKAKTVTKKSKKK